MVASTGAWITRAIRLIPRSRPMPSALPFTDFPEYARATGDKEALDIAISLYHDIEKHAFDAKNNGYIEALTREWQPIADMRLSDKDENGSRTMNTHLHIIEPYTNLYRVWKTEELEKSIRNLLDIFTEKLLESGDLSSRPLLQ